MWIAAGLAVVVAGIMVGALAFLEDDRARVRPTHRGTVTAGELRAADLPTAWRGYERGHVEALLARAAQTIEDVRRYGAPEPLEPDDDDAADRPDRTHRPAPPSFLRFTDPEDGPRDAGDEPSGEELEDRGGDGPGGLDR